MQTQYEQEPTASPLLPMNSMQAQEQTHVSECACIPTTAGKRIVSKEEYVQAHAKVALKRYSALLSLFAGVVCAVTAGLCGMGVLMCVLVLLTGHFADVLWPLLCLVPALLLSGGGAYLSLRWGFRTTYAVRPVEVVPITRANIGTLTAPESLVRAASEPVQAQGASLLRAASEAQEQHEEQLLRPAQ